MMAGCGRTAESVEEKHRSVEYMSVVFTWSGSYACGQTYRRGAQHGPCEHTARPEPTTKEKQSSTAQIAASACARNSALSVQNMRKRRRNACVTASVLLMLQMIKYQAFSFSIYLNQARTFTRGKRMIQIYRCGRCPMRRTLTHGGTDTVSAGSRTFRVS